MNTYDPMARLVYRHLDERRTPQPTLVTYARSTNRLPSGYANASPRTYLGRTGRSAQVA